MVKFCFILDNGIMVINLSDWFYILELCSMVCVSDGMWFWDGLIIEDW